MPRPSEGGSPPPPTLVRTAIGCAALLAVSVAAFFLVRHYGQTLTAPPHPPAAVAGDGAIHGGGIFHVLVALAAVIALGQVFGRLCAVVGQPTVIGEVLAGILLGPSLLGMEWSQRILPPDSTPYLGIIAQLGVILYMFLVGLELNAELLRGRAHVAASISQAGIVVPLVLAMLLALWLYPRLASGSVPFTSFALFMGVAMSITAFPVLARILADLGISKGRLGALSLGCAAAADATAWCLLALAVGVARAEPGRAFWVVAGAITYTSVMFVAVRPVATRLAFRWDAQHLPRGAVALVFVALLASAAATQWIGIHALFGAFLLGAVIPHDSPVAQAFTQQLKNVTTVLLLPAFFAFTGMNTNIRLLGSLDQWLICAAIIVVATAGKFGGTLAAARLSGLGWRESAALGTLMNTRGLMELIVLNVGLELGVIPPTLFAMMVIMALVTTIATSPIVRRLLKHENFRAA